MGSATDPLRDEERLGGRSEREVFGLLGLRYVDPELRENRGEVEAALGGSLPRLITPTDIRGDLRVHSAAGGRGGLRGLAMAAAVRGYEYLAVADRVRAGSAGDVARLDAQLDEIARLNGQIHGRPWLLGAAEIEIGRHGELGLPKSLLERLDLTICAIHDPLGLDARRQTERVVGALENPYCTILAHPGGRRVGARELNALDLERVIDAAGEHRRALELDARPGRLDLSDVYCKLARERGVPVAINSAAAAPGELDRIRYGIDQARRGWLEAADVLNARPLGALRTRMPGFY